MSFGLKFTNADNAVILDSEFARLCIVASGVLTNDGSANHGSSNAFPRVVTTQEPPLVFMRPDNVGQGVLTSDVTLRGTPGAWTGFYCRSSRSDGFATGRWFACSFGAQAVATWGLRVWDGAARPLFDSGTPAAVFTRAFQNWTYIKSVQSPTSAWINYYSVPFNFPADEFLMVNSFSMNLLANDNVGRTLFLSWDFPANTLWAQTQAFSNPYNFQLPALFAKMTV